MVARSHMVIPSGVKIVEIGETRVFGSDFEPTSWAQNLAVFLDKTITSETDRAHLGNCQAVRVLELPNLLL